MTGKDNNGNWIIDGFTFHRYPNGAEYERTDVVFGGIQNIHQSAMQLADLIRSADKKHGRRGDASLIWGLIVPGRTVHSRGVWYWIEIRCVHRVPVVHQ